MKQDANNFHFFHSKDADAMSHNKMHADGVSGHMGGIKKPRGRVTAYAFFLQDCRVKQVEQGQTFKLANFARKCARQWHMLLDVEKEPFFAMAQQDEQRFQQEYSTYLQHLKNNPKMRKTATSRRQKPKRIRNPQEPKRALSAFFCYSINERKAVREQNPQLSFGEISKELGRMWSDMDAAGRQKYEQMAERDKERYNEELEEYAKTWLKVQVEGNSGQNPPQQQKVDVTPTQLQVMSNMPVGESTSAAVHPQMQPEELAGLTVPYLTEDEIIETQQAVEALATLQAQDADMNDCEEYWDEIDDAELMTFTFSPSDFL